MEDFVGNTINVGDKVVHQYSSGRSSWLEKCVVTGFSPKMVKTNRGTFNSNKLVVYEKESKDNKSE